MRSLRLSAAVAAPLLLLACGSQETGKISVRLTDAPAALDAAVVTIARIELVGDAGTFVLRDFGDTPVTTDLLTLANDTAELVKDAVVPVGTYTQLRFVITGAYIEVPQTDGGSIIYASSPTYEGLPMGAMMGGTLKMPSYAQSGLKVNLPGGAITVGTGSQVLLVDFDVSQSFGQEAGGSGSWVMHPVMNAVNMTLSGTVDVKVQLGSGVALPGAATLANFSAVLTNDAGSAKTLPLQDLGGGTFGATFPYLIPGSYTLNLTASSVTSFTTVPTVPTLPFTVASGQPTEVSFTVTSAQ